MGHSEKKRHTIPLMGLLFLGATLGTIGIAALLVNMFGR